MSKQLEEVQLYFLAQTELAILVNEDGGKEGVWLPKSQIEWDGGEGYEPKRGEVITVTAPEWLLMDKGLL